MRRRRLLCVLAAGGAGGVAGCLGGGGGGGGSGDSAGTATATTTTSTTTRTERTIESAEKIAIEDARQSLRQTAGRLSPSPTPTEGQQSLDDFVAEPLRDLISAARADLELAGKGDPTARQRERIERLTAIADFLAAYVDFLVLVREATRTFREVTGWMDDGVYEGADEKLASVESALADARETLDVVDSRGSAVATHYEPGERIFAGDLQDLMGEPAEWNVRFDVFAALVEGERKLVAAIDAYRAGTSADANENYDAAAEHFSTASSEATAARESFERAIDISISMKIGADPRRLVCRAGNVEEAAGIYREVVAAAMEGEASQAERTRADARAAFEREC